MFEVYYSIVMQRSKLLTVLRTLLRTDSVTQNGRAICRLRFFNQTLYSLEPKISPDLDGANGPIPKFVQLCMALTKKHLKTLTINIFHHHSCYMFRAIFPKIF